MNQEQIREEIKRIMNKYYTPLSKIAKDVEVTTSLIHRFVHANEEISIKVAAKLEEWLENRMI